MTPLLERFTAKYEVMPGGCWEWIGAIGNDGYGHIWADGRLVGAHRIAYELHVDTIPKGMEMHHICGRRSCVNPAHLVPVTRLQHRDLDRHLICSRGHPRRQAPNGRWVCPSCQAAAARRYYARKVVA
jgi:HNH endonuclease